MEDIYYKKILSTIKLAPRDAVDHKRQENVTHVAQMTRLHKVHTNRYKQRMEYEKLNRQREFFYIPKK